MAHSSSPEAYNQKGEGSALKRVAPALAEAAPYWEEANAALQKLDEARTPAHLSRRSIRVSTAG